MPTATPARDLWQSIYDNLRADIVSGELAPGSRLTETDLAERFATSRGPIRTALKELDRDGLVLVNPRSGTFVSAVSPEDIDEIFGLYEVLWPLAMRRAVARATPADLEHLRELVDAIEPTRGNTAAWIDANLRLHRAIFEVAGHRRLLQIWDVLDGQSRMLATQLADVDPGNLRDTINLHPRIYRALARRDAAAAEKIVMRYLRQMRKLLHVESTPAAVSR